jgi:hypothetical protein
MGRNMKCRLRILQGVACALLSGGAVAEGPALAVWAIGLPHGYIVMEHQAKVIHVTSDDVARGFVQVAGGSRLIVATRSQGDYALHFARRGGLFRAVQVEGIGRTVELGAQGGTVVQRDVPAGKAVVAVNYRFQLAPGTMPGTYAWPLEVVARHALPEGFVASGPNPGPIALSERAAR